MQHARAHTHTHTLARTHATHTYMHTSMLQTLPPPPDGARDELTLGHYNISPDVVLSLGLKERGGARKK